MTEFLFAVVFLTLILLVAAVVYDYVDMMSEFSKAGKRRKQSEKKSRGVVRPRLIRWERSVSDRNRSMTDNAAGTGSAPPDDHDCLKSPSRR